MRFDVPARTATVRRMSVTFPEQWASVNALLAHDWLTGMRGGERCLEWLCLGFPDAPICTLVCEKEAVSETLQRHRIVASPLQRLPFGRSRFRMLLPFFPALIERIRAPQADLLISTSHCVAKGLIPPTGARHLCYCFTPMRYALFYEEYFGRNPAKRRVVKPMLDRLQRWDRAASARVDRFVAISQHVRDRIRRLYDRDADVVYPPVDIERYTPGAERAGDFDLIVSALVPYKRIDLAVRAYSRHGFPLTVVGTGSEFQRLRADASSNVTFLGWRSDEEITELYRNCRFLVFPGEEDFGIVPLEAQACGTPVLAYARGGALETLVPGETAEFFENQTEAALIEAIEKAAARTWDRDRIRANAERFAPQQFIDGLATSIQACLSA